MSFATRSQFSILRLPLWRAIALAVVLAILWSQSADSAEPPSNSSTLTIVERTLAQDQGGWFINYRLRYHGRTGMIVAPTEIMAKLEGWVSNSRVAAHNLPRVSSLVISGAAGLSGTAEVITAGDESQRCRERATVQVWTDVSADNDVFTTSASTPKSTGTERQSLISLAPETIARVRIRLEHLHFLYGDYDPLLGTRGLELHLGTATLRDSLPLDCEQYRAQAKYTWPTPLEDRLDTHHFMSAPDSLHLEAHIPGNQYYRFPERPVRYGTKMCLRYWYYIARGTEGDCRARIAQYKDTPTAWKVLSDGGHEECLTTVGRWVKVERIFRTQPDATTLALDFRICGADVGEMWIDDVSLEPVGCTAQTGP